MAGDPADQAMVARAHERFAGDRRRRRPFTGGSLPNLVVIGGLKCGTTSLHHYLHLHPAIGMSKPKELNFFIEELNWGLGREWYASRFPAAKIRGESSPHYTNRPRFEGVAGRMRDVLGPGAKLIYMVRNPIRRLLSHYVHNLGGGYEERPLAEAIAGEENSYVQRGMYAFQLEPYLAAFPPGQILVVSQEELGDERDATMRRVFEFLEVESDFSSEQFDRQWETGGAKSQGGFRLMDRAVRLPGLRALDRNFDRMPDRLRWVVERIVHDPESGQGAKPELPEAERERLAELFRPDTERLEATLGRSMGWEL